MFIISKDLMIDIYSIQVVDKSENLIRRHLFKPNEYEYAIDLALSSGTVYSLVYDDESQRNIIFDSIVQARLSELPYYALHGTGLTYVTQTGN